MSIYAKPDERSSRESEAHRLLEQETKHLRKRAGVRHGHASARTTILQFGVFILLILFVCVWFLDPVVYSFKRDTAAKAYLYLRAHNETTLATDLYNSVYFDGTDQIHLHRQEATPSEAMGNFSNMTEAKAAAQDCLDFLGKVHALKVGDTDKLDYFNYCRWFVFYKTGIAPSVPIRFFQSSLNGWQLFPTPAPKDPNDPFNNI